MSQDIAQAKLRGMSPQHRANHEAGLNGCHNREPFKTEQWVQDGYHEAHLYTDGQGAWVTRTPRFKRVPFRMATECQYTVDPMGQGGNDPRCAGCKWKRAQ